MKTFFFAAGIGIVLIVGGFVFDSFIGDFSEEMLAGCKALEDRISEDNASAEVDGIEKFLEKKKTLLASIINHENIDEIETCITEIKGYIKSGDSKEAMVRCEKLKLLVARLPMEYGLSVQNIL